MQSHTTWGPSQNPVKPPPSDFFCTFSGWHFVIQECTIFVHHQQITTGVQDE